MLANDDRTLLEDLGLRGGGVGGGGVGGGGGGGGVGVSPAAAVAA